LRYTGEGSSKRNDLQIEQLSFVGRRSDVPSFGLAAVLEYQYGRGELSLRSADPLAPPIVENRFCEDERDLAALVACYKDTLAFAQQSPLADMIDDVRYPKRAFELTDEDIAALCRKFSGSGYHPCGTAKMGPATDPLAVVNEQGCCHFADGLVVADASIMPSVPRANTNLTCIMIGEQVGEWLRCNPAYYGL